VVSRRHAGLGSAGPDHRQTGQVNGKQQLKTGRDAPFFFIAPN